MINELNILTDAHRYKMERAVLMCEGEDVQQDNTCAQGNMWA